MAPSFQRGHRANDELRRVLQNDRDAISSADTVREKPARQPIA